MHKSMGMRALATTPRMWARSTRVLTSHGRVVQQTAAYSNTTSPSPSTSTRSYRSPPSLNTPALRQAMAQDNSAIHARYVAQSLSQFSGDIDTMEPKQVAHLIRLCSRINKLKEALDVYTIAIQHKKVTAHVVETALKACFSCKEPESTDKVILLATEAGVEMDQHVIAAIQVGFTECDRLGSRAKGFPMDYKDNMLLAALLKNGNLEQAGEVLKAMYSTKEQYGLPDDETWVAAAKASSATKNPQTLLDLISEVGDENAKAGKFSAGFYTHLICGAAASDSSLAWDLYLKSKECGIVGGVQHYHLIMTSFIKSKLNEAIPTIYEDMKNLGVVPDETTYIVVLASLVKLSQFDKASIVLQEMRDRKIAPNQQLYTVILDTLAKMEMSKDGLKPTTGMWSSLMRSMARTIQYERAVKVLDKLKNSKIEDVSYRTLLGTLSHIRRGEYSTSSLDELKNTGMQFDENLRNAMLILGEEDDGSNMEAILAQMKAAEVKPDEGIFNFLMDSAVRSRNVDQVKRIMARMEEYKIPPSEVTWNIYMRGLGIAGLTEEILKIWETKVPEGKRNLIDYNTVLHLTQNKVMSKCNRLDLVAKMFNEMNQSGMEPNEITANILINAYAKALQLDNCFTIFSAFKEKFGVLSAVAYNMLIWACLFNKSPDKAILVLDVTPLSSFGWDAASEGIKNIAKLEQSWENMQKQPTALENSVSLVKLCVECNRPDLIQRVVNLSHQASGVSWSEVDTKLESKEREVITNWVKEGRMAFSETDVTQLAGNRKPRYNNKKSMRRRDDSGNNSATTTETTNNTTTTTSENNTTTTASEATQATEATTEVKEATETKTTGATETTEETPEAKSEETKETEIKVEKKD